MTRGRRSELRHVAQHLYRHFGLLERTLSLALVRGAMAPVCAQRILAAQQFPVTEVDRVAAPGVRGDAVSQPVPCGPAVVGNGHPCTVEPGHESGGQPRRRLGVISLPESA